MLNDEDLTNIFQRRNKITEKIALFRTLSAVALGGLVMNFIYAIGVYDGEVDGSYNVINMAGIALAGIGYIATERLRVNAEDLDSQTKDILADANLIETDDDSEI